MEIAEACLFIYATKPRGFVESLKTRRDRAPKLISSASSGPTRPLLPPNQNGAVVQKIRSQALDFVVQRPFSLQSIWVTLSSLNSQIGKEWTESANRVLTAIKECPTSKATDLLQTIRGTSTWQEVVAKVFKQHTEVPWTKKSRNRCKRSSKRNFPPAWPVENKEFLAGLAELSERASKLSERASNYDSSAPRKVLPPALLLEIAETCLFLFALVTKLLSKHAGLLGSNLKVKWQAWKPKKRGAAQTNKVAWPASMPAPPRLPTDDVLMRGVQEKKRRLEPTGGSALWANEYPYELAASLGAGGLAALRLKIRLEPQELHDLCTFAALQVGLPVIQDLEGGKYKALADWVRTEYNVPDNKGAHAQELIEKRLLEAVLSASIYERGEAADIELLFAESQYYEPAACFKAAIALAC
eukprot:g70040.t1